MASIVMSASLAFYTGFFGNDTNWAAMIPNVPHPSYDAWYFTNNPRIFERLAHTGWKRVWVSTPIHGDNVKDALSSKELRCCPERFPELANYDYLCWLDSKMHFTSWAAFEEMWEALRSSETLLVAATQHPTPYTSVWGEYEAAIKYEKYAREKDAYRRYIEDQLAKGMDVSKPQRICCGFRLMKMVPRRKELGETWLQHIHMCGIEDQITWQFVHQLYEEAIVIFPYQHCWRPA